MSWCDFSDQSCGPIPETMQRIVKRCELCGVGFTTLPMTNLRDCPRCAKREEVNAPIREHLQQRQRDKCNGIRNRRNAYLAAQKALSMREAVQ